MLLKTPVYDDLVNITIQGETVIEPGNTLDLDFLISPNRIGRMTAAGFDLPVGLEGLLSSVELPMDLKPDSPVELRYSFITAEDRETFGEITVNLVFQFEEGERNLSERIWISIFPRAGAYNPEGLSNELRERFLKVANARPRNGHIFLADYSAFFRDFLNIKIAPEIAGFLSEDFALPVEGLPVDEETRLQIIWGQKSFYGIEGITFFGEEECEEPEEGFNPVLAREIPEQGDI